MEHEDFVQTARDLLDESDREFAAGDRPQASEKLWGAASHAVMAVASRRDLSCGSPRELKYAVTQLAQESDDPFLQAAFAVAEKFRSNFYHDEMQDYELRSDIPTVHRFVNRMLALAGNGTA